MKIYTKTGDQGETGLLGGVRVSKNHPVVQACGELDETNSLIGLALSAELPDDFQEILTRVQQDLFVLGSQVAACQSASNRAAELSADSIAWLEQTIDRCNEGLPPMDAFILPGGAPAAAQLHVARCVCRRAERAVTGLATGGGLSQDLSQVIVYLNRLSDLIFVLARKLNFLLDSAETKWLPCK